MSSFPRTPQLMGVPLNCFFVVHGISGNVHHHRQRGESAVRLTGFTVTGNPGNSVGSAIVSVTGLAGGTLEYVFNLTGQVAGNPASTEVLDIIFPLPTPSAVAGKREK